MSDQPNERDYSDNILPYELDGEFVVSHGHAVCEMIDSEMASGVNDRAETVFRITVIAPNLSLTVETVDLSQLEVLGTLKAMYMMQRASNTDEREQLPPAFRDAYCIIAYLGDQIRGWEDRVTEREENSDYQTEPSEWIKTS